MWSCRRRLQLRYLFPNLVILGICYRVCKFALCPFFQQIFSLNREFLQAKSLLCALFRWESHIKKEKKQRERGCKLAQNTLLIINQYNSFYA